MEARPLVSVVDDDESVRESLPDLLQVFGFAAETFASAGGVPRVRSHRGHALSDP
jgi:FixJ family two-component response regulator